MKQNRLPRNKELKEFSTKLRNDATPEENKLWFEFLRTYPVRFNRQRIVGNYILDFYCAKAKLVVEIDGSQHYENKGISYDSKRTDYLEELGLYVLRFSNLEINERFYEVCTVIDEAVKKRIK
ncbi:MAG: endonuclease domain-containing protein [Acutalibacteraceae bacterium]